MLSIKRYTPDYFDKWNKFVEESNNGTIFHRLDFLNYHEDKFKDNENHLIWLKGEHIFAVMPMAVFEIDKKRIAKSPFGGSYGGIVTRETPNYSTSNEIVTLLVEYLKQMKVNELTVTPPLSILSKKHSDTLFFSFLENGFKIVNSDISSIVEFNNQNLEDEVFTSRARNMARKARKENVIPKFMQNVDDFWKLMNITFEKHGAKPTHTYEEWKYLCEKFPDRFWNDVSYLEDKPIAGIGHILVNQFTDSSFYLCSDPEYSATQALSLLIYESLLKAQSLGYRWFDFGTSSVNMKGRENIFRFKESFGTVGLFRNTLMIIFT